MDILTEWDYKKSSTEKTSMLLFIFSLPIVPLDSGFQPNDCIEESMYSAVWMAISDTNGKIKMCLWGQA